MVTITVEGEGEYLYLTEGVLPDSDSILRRFPARSGPPIPWDELPAEEDAKRAWLLTLHGYQIANSHWYEYNGGPRLESWVVGRGQGGVFSPWFADADENYRILIHRFPTGTLSSTAVPHRPQDSWHRLYTKLGVKRQRMPSSDRLMPLRSLLDAMHRAYVASPDALEPLVRATGHAYARSSGPTSGFNSLLWYGS